MLHHEREAFHNLTIEVSGLAIHPDYPHLEASPDGIVKCDCCGFGVLELKCQFSCKNQCFAEAVNSDTDFCLMGTGRLKTWHAYYYQVQTQMKLTNTGYGDFVLWSPAELLIL